MENVQQRKRTVFFENIPKHLLIFREFISILEKFFFVYYDDDRRLYLYWLTEDEKKWIEKRNFLEVNNLSIKLKFKQVLFIKIHYDYISTHLIIRDYIDFSDNKIEQEFYPQLTCLNFKTPYDIEFVNKRKYSLQLKTILKLGKLQQEFFKKYFEVLTDENFFMKDILRDFEENEFNLNIPVDFSMLKQACNKKHLLELKTKMKLTPIYNKISLNHAYSVIKTQKWIEKSEVNKLLILDSKHCNMESLAERERITKFIISYYWEKLKEKEKWTTEDDYIDFENFMEDFIRFHLNLKLKINLKINSYQRLVEIHNTLSPKIKMKTKKIKLKKSNPFLKLSLPEKFIRIETVEQLEEEGRLNRNCVFSYLDRINEEKCIIYTTTWRKKKYTIEIIIKNKKFLLNQITGFANSKAPKMLKESLKKILENQKLA